MPLIEKITVPAPGMDALRADARGEGYKLVEKLIADWESGANRFDGPGEILCGHFDRGLLVAIGGVHRDPFVPDANVGRLRRIYVRPAWRGRGLGEALVEHLLEHARSHFSSIRLRTESPTAARLYERLGFSPCEQFEATHIIHYK